ncbi:MAG: response regulator transcription factor, partial [Actinobacteria bacterium]|nr:response regulator transcription factor [Actinomycetota bacterium]
MRAPPGPVTFPADGGCDGLDSARRSDVHGAPSDALRQGGHTVADERIRILIADDHELFRRGLRMVLEDEPDIEVLGEAGDGQTAAELALEEIPDCVVMDVRM